MDASANPVRLERLSTADSPTLSADGAMASDAIFALSVPYHLTKSADSHICQHRCRNTRSDGGRAANPVLTIRPKLSNMATQPQNREPIREERQRRVADGGRLNGESMQVRWHGNSLVVGLTAYGVKTHDLDDDCEVRVETYQDGIWIEVGDNE